MPTHLELILAYAMLLNFIGSTNGPWYLGSQDLVLDDSNLSMIATKRWLYMINCLIMALNEQWSKPKLGSYFYCFGLGVYAAGCTEEPTGNYK